MHGVELSSASGLTFDELQRIRKVISNGKSGETGVRKNLETTKVPWFEVAKFLYAETKADLRAKLVTKITKNTKNSDYWVEHPQLYWNYFRTTQDLRIAYDEVEKQFVRRDLYGYWQELIQDLKQDIEHFTPRSVLELGCGYGRNLIGLQKANCAGKDWLGLDSSSVAIAATELNLAVEGLSASLTKSDFKDTKIKSKSVDVAYSVWSLPYGCSSSARDMDDIIDEAVRISGKGLVFYEPDFSVGIYGFKKDSKYWDLNYFLKALTKRGFSPESKILRFRINPHIRMIKIQVAL
jgi:ubiquinone/menaquinone biosynthesis C-methylase UbiE